MAEVFDNDLDNYLNREEDDSNDDYTFDGDYERADRAYEEARDLAAVEFLNTRYSYMCRLWL